MSEEKEIVDTMCIGAIIAELAEFAPDEARRVAEASARYRSDAFMNVFYYMEAALAELRRNGFEVMKKIEQ